MRILIATQFYKCIETNRAFIIESERKAQNLKKQLLEGGWIKVQIYEVDGVNFGTLNMKTK